MCTLTPSKLWPVPFLQCVAGYHGANCSEEINECLSQPCQNGGTCIDLTNTYKCSCPRGTQGKSGDLGKGDKDPARAHSISPCGTNLSRKMDFTGAVPLSLGPGS